MVRTVLLSLVALFVFSAMVPEAAGATLRSRRGDDGGEDGGDGAGGLAGALSGMMGGSGDGADGGGADDDDDANMVGGHKKKKADTGGIDVSGLENGLKSGGVNQLTMMLKAMHAAQSPSTQHIIKGDNGEQMYDFRDMDDGTTTTFAPIQMTERPTMPPKSQAFEIPSAPTVSLGSDGKITGLKPAMAQVAQTKTKSGANDIWSQVTSAVTSESDDQHPLLDAYNKGLNNKKSVVLPPRSAAPQPQVQAAQPMAAAAEAAPMVGALHLPVAQPAAMMQFLQPAAAPSLPMAQVSSVSGNTASALYQGLAMLDQNMNVLMSEAAALNEKEADTGALASKLDQTSQKLLSYENTMDKRVKALEEKNALMKKQISLQARVIKTMEQSTPMKHKMQSATKGKARQQSGTTKSKVPKKP